MTIAGMFGVVQNMKIPIIMKLNEASAEMKEKKSDQGTQGGSSAAVHWQRSEKCIPDGSSLPQNDSQLAASSDRTVQKVTNVYWFFRMF